MVQFAFGTWRGPVTFTNNFDQGNHSHTCGMYGDARMRRMLGSDNACTASTRRAPVQRPTFFVNHNNKI